MIIENNAIGLVLTTLVWGIFIKYISSVNLKYITYNSYNKKYKYVWFNLFTNLKTLAEKDNSKNHFQLKWLTFFSLFFTTSKHIILLLLTIQNPKYIYLVLISLLIRFYNAFFVIRNFDKFVNQNNDIEIADAPMLAYFTELLNYVIDIFTLFLLCQQLVRLIIIL